MAPSASATGSRPSPRPSNPEAPDALTRAMISTAVILAASMVIIDTTIVIIALPNMTAALGATEDTITWVLTSYIVAVAVATPLTGVVCDRLGRRRVAIAAVAAFALASAACGAATSLGEMVAFRIIQGAFGATLVPIAQSVLLDINPPERHGRAMGLFGVGVVVAPIIGPTLGGWITESWSWRWVFYVNIPIGLAALASMFAVLPASAPRARRFDLFGFLTLAAFLGCVQLLLDRGQGEDWFAAGEIIAYALVAICALWVFLVHSTTSRDPFISLALFADRNFVLALVFIFIIGALLLASGVIVAPMLQAILGYPALTAGIIMAPRGIGSMLAMMAAGRLVERVDPRALVALSFTLMAVSVLQMTRFDVSMGVGPIVFWGFIQGLGFGFGFVPLSTMAFNTLAPALRTDGASFYSLMRNFGSSVGTAVIATVFARNIQHHHAALADNVSAFNPAFEIWSARLGGSEGLDLAAVELEIGRQAAMMSYLDSFALMTAASLAALPLVLLLRPLRR